ncbi:MAG: lysophospholipid acyltransferase family protein [Candidatus Cloacimonadaceae bacterium]|jgi:1-acyl-sn-glycerol-3-phosphate acyltransferase|nr:1-acyl-sn-glycerol-3-phosphate acyltransferase [Candidatus Cloacimonadota bacterium]MCB5258110.1 1-acyl-sn-glycerol-3-phosphate acyltransferase [Candidatus Cloacimonadota bacterium]MDD5625198.1 lysophospholipid acyltransferase family protein [Candidatus Cloacimonadota bacterium]MDY0111626.1 lysophospholipid acyltransferase family protein [Candidatus Syntrophosphaera sp.]
MWIVKLFHTIWQMIILWFFVCRSYFIHLFAKNPIKRRWLEIKNMSYTSRKFLRAFHIKLRVKNQEVFQKLKDKNYLLVANHSSLLDIFLLGAIDNYVFITSTEMSETPVIGNIIRRGGCLYTDRKNKIRLPQEIKRFAEMLKKGFKVVLFPEKPGTDGSKVNEFRSSLFQSAIDAACTVVPVCIRYLKLDGKPINSKNRFVIFWNKGINYLKYYWNLLAHKMEVEINFLDPIEFDPQRDRNELCQLTYEKVCNTFESYEKRVAN